MTKTGPSTSATGGSSESQASSLDARAWQPRPGISAAIRIVAAAIPTLTSFVAVWAALEIAPRPRAAVLAVLWLLLMVAVALAGMRAAGVATNRLAPLAALFRMSLVFPDAAPSRFQSALRAHGGRQLTRDAEAGFATHQAAAEHLVALLTQLSAHDRLTRGHSERVRAYSVMLGEELDLGSDALTKLNWAALAHDVGKLHVPESILNKNGRPTEEEWLVLKGHPGAASAHIELLRPWLGDWVDCATQHHERYDGAGYPAGLAGNDISLAGRIVSIADAFDVMTATRSYKRPFPAAQARAELLRNAGSQFDPSLVRSFLQISIPPQRWYLGWFGWLAHLPQMLRLPVIPAAQTVGGVVAAGTVAVAAIIAAPLTEDAPAEIDFAVERAVEGEAAAPSTGTATGGPTTTLAEGSEPTSPTGSPTATTTTTAVGPDTTTPIAPGVPTSTTVAPGPTSSTTQPPPSSSTTTVTTSSTSTTSTTTTSTTTTTTTTAPPAVTTANDDAQVVVVIIGGTIRVLDNDDFGSSSPDLLTLAVIQSPTKGDATVVADSIVYVPGFLQTGIDTFRYRICSVSGSCDTATVTVTIAL